MNAGITLDTGTAQNIWESEPVRQNQMEEYMFLGLRKIEGVSKTDFRQTFGRSIENAYGKVLIDMYQKQLLEDTGEYIRLTEKGIDVSNYVMSEFLF